ncbi:ATP-binding protein [Candidatus Saccharibacteria bacterium]|nr:ATP-binding protein [Candidatus Saccharibacteria bacterium]
MSTQLVLYLMMGLPGAGKTTVAEHISQLTGALHISSDDIRRELFPHSTFTQSEHDQLYAELDKRVEQALRTGHSVVYDANLNRRQHRDEKRALAEQLTVVTKLIWVKTPEEIARERRVNDQPQHDLTPTNETPADMFDRIAQLLEPPQTDETYVMIDGQHVSTESVSSALGI